MLSITLTLSSCFSTGYSKLTHLLTFLRFDKNTEVGNNTNAEPNPSLVADVGSAKALR